jgi:hypothetical protein
MGERREKDELHEAIHVGGGRGLLRRVQQHITDAELNVGGHHR